MLYELHRADPAHPSTLVPNRGHDGRLWSEPEELRIRHLRNAQVFDGDVFGLGIPAGRVEGVPRLGLGFSSADWPLGVVTASRSDGLARLPFVNYQANSHAQHG